MARKTKEEAQITRQRLLDAAEHVFHAKGVSRTSLDDVARHAGMTRGAIYWHFKDKAALFEALIVRASADFERQLQEQLAQVPPNALAERIVRRAELIFHIIAEQPKSRQVLEIVEFKMERIADLEPLRQLWEREIADCMEDMRADMRAAQIAHAEQAARGLDALIHGLLRLWLSHPETFDLREQGAAIVRTYLSGLGLVHQPH